MATGQVGMIPSGTSFGYATTTDPLVDQTTHALQVTPLVGVILVINGGTGSATLTNHGVLIGHAASPVTATSAGTAGQVLTSNGASADPTFQDGTVPINDQTGTTYGLVLTDAGHLVTLTNGSAITVTIPANASVAFPIGTEILLFQGGAGQVTVAITTDTLRSTPGAKLRAQYSCATLIKLTSTTWVLSGDVSA